jgi:glycosyltransferase involved in cell wall biosynthesis
MDDRVRETLSIVICTRNRPASLLRCIASLATQTRRPDELAIVDASSPRLPARLRRRVRKRMRGTSVRWLSSEPGLPRQRNLGIDRTSGSVVVFLDDDVVLEPGYLGAVATIYEDDVYGAIGGVGGAQVPDPTPHEPPWREAACRLFLLESYGDGTVKRSGRPRYLMSPTRMQAVEFLSGCNMSFRREVLSELEFDERLAGYALGEDLDFSYRVSRRWTLVATPDARLEHRHAATGRPETDDFRAMSIFNKYLFFRERVARGPLDWAAFAWATLGGIALRLRDPVHRGMRGVVRGHWLVLRHCLTGALPPDGPKPSRRWARTARPLVSVVVPARDEEATLPACLASIRAQERIAGGFEVIVVENGSHDATRAVAQAIAREDRRIRVLASDARNHAEAMNDGIMTARGDVVARVDAHSRIAPDYLRRVVAALARHPEAAAVGGPFLPAGETPVERAIGLARSSPFGVGGGYGSDRATHDHPVRSVQCGAYWREALVDVGLFDPAMAYGEDEELNWRLVQRGSVVVLSPELRQPYRPRATFAALARQYWNYGQGRARVLRKHPDFLALRHLAPSALLLALVVLGVPALFGASRAATGVALILVAYLATLALAGVQALRRAGDAREAALVPVAIACMHASYGAGFLAQLLRSALETPEPPSDRADVAAVEWPPG